MKEQRIAVFPGTFDPITLGHVDILKRSLELFDEIIIAIGVNTKKATLFSLEQRISWIKAIFADEEKVSVEQYDTLTVEFCKQRGANFLLRGLRNGTDFDYEIHIAQTNQKLAPGIETVFVMSSPELSYISSTIVRDLIIYKGDYKSMVPSEVLVLNSEQ